MNKTLRRCLEKKRRREYTKVSKNREGTMYPSDISDKEWEILEPYVAQGAIGRPRKHDIRACNKIYNERRLSVENAAKRFSAMENSIRPLF